MLSATNIICSYFRVQHTQIRNSNTKEAIDLHQVNIRTLLYLTHTLKKNKKSAIITWELTILLLGFQIFPSGTYNINLGKISYN
jgi:hypothetical protein